MYLRKKCKIKPTRQIFISCSTIDLKAKVRTFHFSLTIPFPQVCTYWINFNLLSSHYVLGTVPGARNTKMKSYISSDEEFRNIHELKCLCLLIWNMVWNVVNTQGKRYLSLPENSGSFSTLKYRDLLQKSIPTILPFSHCFSPCLLHSNTLSKMSVGRVHPTHKKETKTWYQVCCLSCLIVLIHSNFNSK